MSSGHWLEGELGPETVLGRHTLASPTLPLPQWLMSHSSFSIRERRTPAAAEAPFFLELCLLPPLRLAPGVAVCDTAVALPLHRHAQLSADQLGGRGQDAGCVLGPGGSPAGRCQPGMWSPEGREAWEAAQQGLVFQGRRDWQDKGRPWKHPLLKSGLAISYHLTPLCFFAVSTYTNAFAITQFFGVLCAPWNGLLMDRLKQKYQKEAQRTGKMGEGPGEEGSAFTSCRLLLLLTFSPCAHSFIQPPVTE